VRFSHARKRDGQRDIRGRSTRLPSVPMLSQMGTSNGTSEATGYGMPNDSLAREPVRH
jgi:hypothetical protein